MIYTTVDIIFDNHEPKIEIEKGKLTCKVKEHDTEVWMAMSPEFASKLANQLNVALMDLDIAKEHYAKRPDKSIPS